MRRISLWTNPQHMLKSSQRCDDLVSSSIAPLTLFDLWPFIYESSIYRSFSSRVRSRPALSIWETLLSIQTAVITISFAIYIYHSP